MPRRSALKPIHSNRRPGTQLSIEHKHELYRRALAGQSADQIAAEDGTPKSTITTILRKARQRGTLAVAPRSGRPKKHTDRDDRKILRAARNMPKLRYDALRRETGLDFSTSLLKRILRENGITNKTAKKQPILNETQERPSNDGRQRASKSAQSTAGAP